MLQKCRVKKEEARGYHCMHMYVYIYIYQGGLNAKLEQRISRDASDVYPSCGPSLLCAT